MKTLTLNINTINTVAATINDSDIDVGTKDYIQRYLSDIEYMILPELEGKDLLMYLSEPDNYESLRSFYVKYFHNLGYEILIEDDDNYINFINLINSLGESLYFLINTNQN